MPDRPSSPAPAWLTTLLFALAAAMGMAVIVFAAVHERQPLFTFLGALVTLSAVLGLFLDYRRRRR